MRLKYNRILTSATDTYNIINSQANAKLDLSCADPKNFISLSDLRTDLELIKGRNFPLVRDVMNALESQRIIISTANNVSSSLTYIPMMNKSNTEIEKVIVNVARFSKSVKGVDPTTGEFKSSISIIGGYEVLYNALFGAYMVLMSQRIFMDNNATTVVREIYVDLFSQIISRNFGNPVDGEKFRFMVNHFFFNGDVTGMEVAQATRFQLDKASVLESQYPDWFARQEGLQLGKFIEILANEFPSLSRRNLDPKNFVIQSATSLGDNALYIMDNYAYLLGVLATRSRKSKIFAGYMLKSVESEAGTLLSALTRASI